MTDQADAWRVGAVLMVGGDGGRLTASMLARLGVDHMLVCARPRHCFAQVAHLSEAFMLEPGDVITRSRR